MLFITFFFSVQRQLKGLLRMMFTERERLKNSLEREGDVSASQQHTVAMLRQALAEVRFFVFLIAAKKSLHNLFMFCLRVGLSVSCFFLSLSQKLLKGF